MLPSANEAAEAVGYYLSGGNLNNFYAMMNARAKELGCTNTNFASTNGLVDMEGGNYSTAHDLFLIAQECWKHEIFRTVCGTTLYWMPITDIPKHSVAQYPDQNPNASYFITTTNRMIQPSSCLLYTSSQVKASSGSRATRKLPSRRVTWANTWV